MLDFDAETPEQILVIVSGLQRQDLGPTALADATKPAETKSNKVPVAALMKAIGKMPDKTKKVLIAVSDYEPGWTTTELCAASGVGTTGVGSAVKHCRDALRANGVKVAFELVRDSGGGPAKMKVDHDLVTAVQNLKTQGMV